MTVSHFATCNDCSKIYRIRYGLGNNFPQQSSFECENCSNKITIGLVTYKKGFFFKGADINSDDSLFDNPEVIVKNLHPEIPTKKEEENNPVHFQTMDVFRKIEKSKTNFGEFRSEQYFWKDFNSKWIEIEKPLRILAFKGEDKLIEVCNLTINELKEKFDYWVSIFINKLLTKENKSLQKEYSSFKNEDLQNCIKNDSTYLKKIYLFCKTYMDTSVHFQSTVLHQKFNWPIGKKSIANIDWDAISKVYGDLYELVGDFYVIPTMINNIKSGRSYDQFNTPGFNIEKYLATDKAKRFENFQENQELCGLIKDYYPWLRNGTHHQNSHYDSDNNLIEVRTGKGGKNLTKLPTVEYVQYCNSLFGIGLLISNLIIHVKAN